MVSSCASLDDRAGRLHDRDEHGDSLDAERSPRTGGSFASDCGGFESAVISGFGRLMTGEEAGAGVAQAGRAAGVVRCAGRPLAVIWPGPAVPVCVL